jgi:hypothetical protein
MKVSEQLVMMQQCSCEDQNKEQIEVHDDNVSWCLYRVCTTWKTARKPEGAIRSDILRGYGRTGGTSPTSPRHQVPSPHYWKSKCGQDIDSSTSLRYHRESRDLHQFIGSWQTGTTSSLVALPISHRPARFNSNLRWRLGRLVLVRDG